MANYASLKDTIDQYITTNGKGDITGAILNDVLKSIINSIGADFLFGGIVEPSSTVGSPDQNVFYIAIKSGTYTNFGNVVIPNGITIFKWNGSWYSQILFAGDGGVFDITAYNNNTKYADLTAALGTNGANVPQNIQKGGMSVKFVQTSDNKYIQARCMAQNFTADTTQWQGVDDEPTAGSDNLVKSGGVEEKESLIAHNIGGITSTLITMTPNGYIQCDGNIGTEVSLTPVVSTPWRYAVVDCSAKDVFYVSGRGGSAPRLYCFIDSSNRIIANAVSSLNQIEPLKLIAPAGTAKLIINDLNTGRKSYKGETPVVDGADAEPIAGSNKLVKSGGVSQILGNNYNVWVQGCIDDRDGSIFNISTRITSNFLKKPRIEITDEVGIFRIAYYDNNYNYIGYEDISSGIRSWSYDGDYIVRITIYSNSAITPQSNVIKSLSCDSILSILDTLSEDVQNIPNIQNDISQINAISGYSSWSQGYITSEGVLANDSKKVTSCLLNKPSIVIKNIYGLFSYALYDKNGFVSIHYFSGGVRSWSYNGDYNVRITVYSNEAMNPQSDFLDDMSFGYNREIEELSNLTINMASLFGKRITGCGDSLSAGAHVERGFYEKKLAELGGGIYNGVYSYGGVASIPTSEHDTQHRIKEFIANNTNTDVLIIENVNDAWLSYTRVGNTFTKRGSIQDNSFMFSKYETSSITYASSTEALEAFENNFNSFVQDIVNKTKGTTLRIPYGTSKIELTITNGTTSAGTIIISIGTNTYNTTVTAGMTASEVAQAIAITHFDGYAVSVSSNVVTFTLESGYSIGELTFNANSTGASASSETTTASNYVYKFFMGTTPEEFVVKANWRGSNDISLYSLYKGIIEYLQENRPELRIVWFIPTTWILDFTNPDASMVNADGSWNLYKIMESPYDTYFYTRQRLLREIQTEVCRYYGIECYNAVDNVGITPYNIETYYYSGDIHPKADAYIKWAEFMYRYMK